MACKTAVLTSNISSLPEVVGDAGVLVEPQEIDSIIAGLQTLIDDTTLRQKLAQRGLQQTKQFSWEKAAQDTLAVYQQISTY